MPTEYGTVTIDVEVCKGCELCVAACPPQVLSMSAAVNSRGYRYPLLSVGCTGCGRCVDSCPDFVFEAYKFEQPVRHGPCTGPGDLEVSR